MSPLLTLVHSPLVGPITWGPLATVLREAGHDVVVPDLRSTVAGGPPYGPRQADVIGNSVRGRPTILVGHSGAGPILPEVGDAVGRVVGYIFVDAGLPAPETSWFQSAPAELAAQLRGMAQDGWLPPWPRWWSRHELRDQVPDAELRGRFSAECPRLPVALFDEIRPPAAAWSDRPCGYLRCSAAYQQHADAARALGWPTIELDDRHLAVMTDPGRIVEPLLDLVAAIQR